MMAKDADEDVLFITGKVESCNDFLHTSLTMSSLAIFSDHHSVSRALTKHFCVWQGCGTVGSWWMVGNHRQPESIM